MPGLFLTASSPQDTWPKTSKVAVKKRYKTVRTRRPGSPSGQGPERERKMHCAQQLIVGVLLTASSAHAQSSPPLLEPILSQRSKQRKSLHGSYAIM